MKVIFLDCDGVLNRACANGDTRYFVPECFHEFQRIVAETGAKIVLSTSWREFADWEAMLKDFFGAIRIDIVGKTKIREDSNRELEIKDYITTHFDDIDNFVVIDDDNLIEGFPGHCVRTCETSRIGLDKEWADEAISILGTPESNK